MDDYRLRDPGCPRRGEADPQTGALRLPIDMATTFKLPKFGGKLMDALLLETAARRTPTPAGAIQPCAPWRIGWWHWRHCRTGLAGTRASRRLGRRWSPPAAWPPSRRWS